MMGAAAVVEVLAADAGEARLLVRASSYVRPMTLEVRFDGSPVGEAALLVLARVGCPVPRFACGP